MPAVDLAQSLGRSVSPDLDVYAREIIDVWPELGVDGVRRLARLGTLCRAVAAISWASAGLGTEWIDAPVKTAWIFVEKLETAMKESGLKPTFATQTVSTR
jgi:hypothetical protein